MVIEQLSQLTGEQFIDGQWLAGDGHILHPDNPGLQQSQWSGVSASDVLVNRAVAAARSTVSDWAMLGFEARGEYARRYAELLKQNSDLLAEVIHLENRQTLVGE